MIFLARVCSHYKISKQSKLQQISWFYKINMLVDSWKHNTAKSNTNYDSYY
jgi:hypothetical protein